MINELVARHTVAQAGAVADHFAGQQTFADYQLRKSKNTLRAQIADLATFADYLCEAGVTDCPMAEDLQSDPKFWIGVTWGLVQGFVTWMLGQGFAVTTVNHKLSTVKTYAALATKAGAIDKHELTMIKAVAGYSAKEFKRVDEKRAKTRQSKKKTISTPITPTQARKLKDQPDDSPQGRRDAVIMCLLLDHGLRVGELSKLTVNDVDLAQNELVFYREKVQKAQRHKLSRDAQKALKAWFESGDAPAMGPLLRKSLKSGELSDAGLGAHALWVRVGELGARIGIDDLGPHDCRHYWATRAVKGKTDPFRLMQAGGWTSMQTVQRYVDQAAIANDGVVLDD